jgi:sortase A
MKKKTIVLKVMIMSLLTISLILILIPFSKYFIIGTSQERSNFVEVKKIPSKIPASQNIQAPTFKDSLDSLSSANKRDAVGQVLIPKANIQQPIFIGLLSENMVSGVVSLFPNRDPTNSTLTLIGHHVLHYFSWGNSLLFGGIQSLDKGDEVYVKYLDKYFTYKVESNEIISDRDTNKLVDRGSDYIYLVTCNESTHTNNRVLITAKKTEVKAVKKAWQENIHRIKKYRNHIYLKDFIFPLILVLMVYLALLYYLWWKL